MRRTALIALVQREMYHWCVGAQPVVVCRIIRLLAVNTTSLEYLVNYNLPNELSLMSAPILTVNWIAFARLVRGGGGESLRNSPATAQEMGVDSDAFSPLSMHADRLHHFCCHTR
jgi:hypothetical protein